MQFANYMAENGESVAVLDADLQQSIAHLRERELKTNPDAKVPWRVWPIFGQDSKAFMDRAEKMDGWILVDCPGSVNDPNLITIFRAADAVVIPYRYDDLVVDSTITFVKVLKQYEVKARLFFLPNNIDVRVKMPIEEQVRKNLKNVGIILPRIKQGVAIMRTSTIRSLDKFQKNAIMFSVDQLIKECGLV